MGDVISFPLRGKSMVKTPSVQVSYYPQDDGSQLFAIEALYPDDTWDVLEYTRDVGMAWKLAGIVAIERGLKLLPESIWPGRSHLRAM